MKAILAGALCLALVSAAPGSQAWAGVFTRAVPAGMAPPAVPAGPGAHSVKAPAFAASLAAPSLSLPVLTYPGVASSPTLAPAARGAAAVAAVAGPTVSAAALPAPAVPARAAVAQTIAAMGRQARPFTAAAAGSAGGSAGAYGAGRSLEAILTRRAPAALAADLSLGAAARAGSLLHRCDDHNHPHHHDDETRAEPLSPAPPMSPQATRAFRFYATGVSAVKVGIETLNLVVPVLLLSHYGTAVMLGALFVSAQVAGMVAGAAAGPLIDRFGSGKILAGSALLQAAVVGSVPLLLALGTPVSMPFLFGVFVANGALSGVFDIARRVALPAIVGYDEAVLRRQNAKLYVSRELAAIFSVLAAGALLQSVGALASMSLHPLSYAVAGAALFIFARGRYQTPGAPFPGPSRPPAAGWRAFFSGAETVIRDPALRLAALVNVPVIALHNFVHAMLAVVYAASILGEPAMAAVLLGAWNAGELAAAAVMTRTRWDIGSAAWVRYAALTGLLAWAMWAVPSIWVAAPAVFLMATGALGGELGLGSFFQSAVPADRQGAAAGFIYSLATGASMLLILAAGAAFDAFGASTGMLLTAAALTAAAVFMLAAARRLGAPRAPR
ncbi:MAG: hypothetical protein HYZ75_18565 [Elusimicrobia bacterium]|nr:hypothetical protein [Elusimicrobiota bacterium]